MVAQIEPDYCQTNSCLIAVGHASIYGKPYPFQDKIVNIVMHGSKDELLYFLKTWIIVHGLYFQQQSQYLCHDSNLKTIAKILTNNTVKLDNESLNEIKLYFLKNSKLNHVNDYVEKFFMVHTLPPVNSIKNLKRQYYVCSSKYTASFVAKVLCWAASYMIKSICPQEFAECAWMNQSKKKSSPNICRCINFYNFVTYRIATEIVISHEPSTRSSNIERIIDIAQHAKEANNFEIVSAIVAGLNFCACGPGRLKKTWSLVSKRYLSIFSELESLTSPLVNYKEYRACIATLQESHKNFVPILSVVLRDIVATGLKKTKDIVEDQIISVGKIILPITRLQVDIPRVSEAKRKYDKFSSLWKSIAGIAPGSEDILMKISYKREPPRNISLMNIDKTVDIVNLSSNSTPAMTDKQNPLKESIDPGANLATFYGTLSKHPSAWNRTEVQVVLESWGLPPDLSVSLSMEHVRNGRLLLKFVPTEDIVSEVQYRILLDTKISELLKNSPRNTKKKRVAVKSTISGWTPNSVSDWLIDAGFGEYSMIFEDNDICGKRLMDLSGADLNDMGIEDSNDRKAILREIKKLCSPQKRKGKKLSLSTVR